MMKNDILTRGGYFTMTRYGYAPTLRVPFLDSRQLPRVPFSGHISSQGSHFQTTAAPKGPILDNISSQGSNFLAIGPSKENIIIFETNDQFVSSKTAFNGPLYRPNQLPRVPF